jgi:hypothetical protein
VNEAALGEYIMIVFMPFVPILAGGVIAFTLTILTIVLFKEFLPKV